MRILADNRTAWPIGGLLRQFAASHLIERDLRGARPPDIDAAQLLDNGRWTTYQKVLILATALTIVLDGVDNQLLPNAVPTLIQEWGRPRREFTDALAIGPFGMMLGGLLGGFVGDRWGRRPALLGSVLIFGAFTAALAFVNSIEALAAVRFLAGVGLGGAMPNAATLASEYVPARNRPLAVTLTIVSIPLGGALAGELAALVIPTFGWRVLFAAGGLISIAVAVLLWGLLPESPRFLARHRASGGPHLPDGDSKYRDRHRRGHRQNRERTRGLCRIDGTRPRGRERILLHLVRLHARGAAGARVDPAPCAAGPLAGAVIRSHLHRRRQSRRA